MIIFACVGIVGVEEPWSWYSAEQILQHMEEAARSAVASRGIWCVIVGTVSAFSTVDLSSVCVQNTAIVALRRELRHFFVDQTDCVDCVLLYFRGSFTLISKLLTVFNSILSESWQLICVLVFTVQVIDVLDDGKWNRHTTTTVICSQEEGENRQDVWTKVLINSFLLFYCL